MGVQISMGRGNFELEGHVGEHSDLNCAKMAEPIEMLMGYGL